MGRKETMSHVEVVSELHRIFHADRPVVEQNNKDITSIIGLLHQEIFELNGHPEDGMTLEDYRAQEISDIQYFVFSLMKVIHAHPDQSSIDGFLVENNLDIPDESIIQLEEGYDYEPEYVRLKFMLRDAADSLYSDAEHTQPISTELIVPIAQKILNIAVALHAVLRRNSTEEMRDKGARNLLKHSIPGYDNLSNNYKDVAKRKGIRWKQEALIPGGGNPGFFDRQWGVYSGPPIEDVNLKPLTVESALQELGLTFQAYLDLATVIPLPAKTPETLR